MKLFKKILALLIIPLLWGQISNAHFYSYGIYKVGNKTVVCLGDYHESKLKKNQINFKQKLDVLSWAKALNASIVVEDIYSDMYPLLQLNSVDNNTKTPLFHLTSWAKHSDIPAISSEFRTIWTLSDNGIGCAKNAFRSILKAVEEIKQYNDSAELNAIYKEELQLFEELLSRNQRFFDLFRNSEKTVKEIRGKLSYYDFQQEIDDILAYCKENIAKVWSAANFFTSRMLDLRLLHDWYNQNSNIVFICAGSTHTGNLAEHFKRLNATCVGSYESEISTELVINLPNYKKSLSEPTAIDINDIIVKYFPDIKPEINTLSLKLLDFKSKYPMLSSLFNDKTIEGSLLITPSLFGFGAAVLTKKICDFLNISRQRQMPIGMSVYGITTLGFYALAYKFYNDNTKLIEIGKDNKNTNVGN